MRDFVTSIMLEAKEIGARFGIPIDAGARRSPRGHAQARRDQDVDAAGRRGEARSVELDALVAAVCELGRLTGVPTPYTNALFGLARLHARTLGLYPAA